MFLTLFPFSHLQAKELPERSNRSFVAAIFELGLKHSSPKVRNQQQRAIVKVSRRRYARDSDGGGDGWGGGVVVGGGVGVLVGGAAGGVVVLVVRGGVVVVVVAGCGGGGGGVENTELLVFPCHLRRRLLFLFPQALQQRLRSRARGSLMFVVQ